MGTTLSLWQDPRHRLVLAAVALITLAMFVKIGIVAGLDQAVAGWIATWRTAASDRWVSALTCFGDVRWFLLCLGFMSLWWWVRGDARAILVLWGAWLLGLGIQEILRVGVAQWRPDTLVVPPASAWLKHIDLAGFTSGHSFRAAYLYGWWASALAQRSTNRARGGVVACVALIVVVGATRLSLNRHWLSDVMGAWMLAVMALAFAQVWRAKWQTTR